MSNIPYNPLDRASLEIWLNSDREDNHERMQRLLTNLPLAIEQELTDRERQVIHMRFTDNKRVSQIAQELNLQKSTVSRTISRATGKLFRALRYSL